MKLSIPVFDRFVLVGFGLVGFILLSFALIIPKGEDVLTINGFHTHFLDWFFSWFTHLGDGLLFIPVLLVLLFHRFGHAFAVLLISVCLGLSVSVLKHVIFPGAERPKMVINMAKAHPVPGVKVHRHNSFPSGHTATAFAISIFLSLIIRKSSFAVLMLITATLAGISRVYLLQHFLLDVAIGALLGIYTATVIYYSCGYIYKPWMHKRLMIQIALKPAGDIRMSGRFVR
jgi:membrane-associated phospholipid phosphatase